MYLTVCQVDSCAQQVHDFRIAFRFTMGADGNLKLTYCSQEGSSWLQTCMSIMPEMEMCTWVSCVMSSFGSASMLLKMLLLYLLSGGWSKKHLRPHFHSGV